MVCETILNREPVAPVRLNADISPELERVIDKALEKDRDLRYQHAADLRADLKRLKRSSDSKHPDTTVPRQSAREREGPLPTVVPSSPAHKPRKSYYLIAAIALILIAGAGAFFFHSSAPGRPPASSQWEQLTFFTDSAVYPTLSSDGRMLAFIRGDDSFMGTGNIYVKMLPSGEPVQLTHDTTVKLGPAFSPDNSLIVYSTMEPWDTWQVPVLGGDPRLFMPNSSSVTWIDGGKRLLFSEIKSGLHMGVVVTDLNRGNSRDVYLPAGSRSMAHHSYVSPDGRWVLVVQMDNQGGILPCRVVPFQGTAEPKVVGPPRGTCLAGAWSPDGQWIYVTAMTNSSRLWRQDLGDFHLWRQRWPDGQPEQLTFGPTSQLGIAMAPDGKSITTSVGSRDESVWLHDKDGDHQISTEGNTSAPIFSIDGRSLYFLMSNGATDDQELWVRDMANGQINKLLPNVPMQDYAVSPDGKNVAYVNRDANGQRNLWIAPTSRRHSPVRLSTTSGDDTPRFLPDGNLIFRSSEGGSNYIYRMRPDGSDRRKLIPQRILELGDLSPDGRWLTAAVPNSDEALTASLAAFAVDGSATVPLCYGYCLASWDTSGKYLYFIDEKTLGKGTYVIPVKNDVVLPEGLTHADDISKTKNQAVLPWWVQSGNGSTVYAYVRDTTRSNLYRIPLQ